MIDSNRPAFFGSYLSTCTLYVPAESLASYQAAEGWKKFGNILPIEGDTPASCIIASGTCGAQGDNLTWTLTCDSVLTISGTGAMADYDWYAGTPWYSVSESIKSIKIEDGVTSIGNNTFDGCTNMTSVEIGNNVSSIGTLAFRDCRSLTSITIPNSVTYIGYWTFNGCTGLTTIEIPNSVTNIGDGPFSECTNLSSIIAAVDNTKYCTIDGVLFSNDKTKIVQYPGAKQGAYTIPHSVTRIGGGAFYGCAGLTSVDVHNSITSIGNSAFRNCSGLTSIEIPNSVTNIGNAAFENCTGLTSITIPNSVTYIEVSAFENCTGLTSITIHNAVTILSQWAFSRCTGLTSFKNYATTPQTINADVFRTVNLSACTLYVPAESLAAYQAANVWKDFGNIVAIEGETPAPCIIASGTCGAQGDNLTWTLSCDSVLTISGTGAMADYSSSSNWPWYSYRESITSVVVEDGVTSIGSYAFDYLVNVTSITLPNTVTQIGWYSVGHCYELTSITIPASVTYISGYAFSYCEKLTAFNVDQNNLYYSSVDGVLFNKDQTQIIRYPIGKEGTHYTIPNTVVSIYEGAFASTKLESIDMPNGIIEIGEWAFSRCTGLTSMVIPDQVSYIGTYAFSYCRNLESVTIPMSVTNIDNGAFIACDNLKTVTNYSTIPQRVDSVCFSYFMGRYYITTSTLYVPAESIELYQAADVWKDFGTIQTIGDTEPATPTIWVPDTIGVSEARALIDAGDIHDHYVYGVVATYPTDPGTYGNTIFWLTDTENETDSLQGYKIYGYDNTAFGSVEDIPFTATDTVLLYASRLMLYNENIYEIYMGHLVEILGSSIIIQSLNYETGVVECNGETGEMVVKLGGDFQSDAIAISLIANFAGTYNTNVTIGGVTLENVTLFFTFVKVENGAHVYHVKMNHQQDGIRYIIDQDISFTCNNEDFGTIDDGSNLPVLTCAEAAVWAVGKANNTISEIDYVVIGYVVKYRDNGEYSETYNNASFYLSDDSTSTSGEFQAYRCKPASADYTSPAIGDKVKVVGKLQVYNGICEIGYI